MSGLAYYANTDLARASLESGINQLIDVVKESFKAYSEDILIVPEKSSQILDAEIQSRVNCMPCTAPSIGYSGVKLVSVFPGNATQGKSNVSGMILLLSAEDGSPVAVADAGFVTALRTALVGGVAATYLAKSNPRDIGLLGAGQEAFMHLYVMAKLFPSLEECRVASRNSASEERFAKAAKSLFPELHIKCCNSEYARAADNADIIITAISGQTPLLKADWVKPGAFYCHVGGIEDEYGVALKSDKIICDSWEALKHRGSPTISHMYDEGLLSDDDIYAELHELIAEEKDGRSNDQEIIYFNSIGIAFTDIYLTAFLTGKCQKLNFGQQLEQQPFNAFDLSNLT